MKHLWTTAAAAALLALAAAGAQAAPEKKSQAEVAKSLRGAEKKAADKKTTAGKKAEATPAKAKKAADPAPTAKSKKAEAEVPTKGPVAKGPLKTEAGVPVTVGRGDTLAEVAKKTGVDRQSLIELNKLKPPYALKAGQKLRLPERRYYAVQSGDTLYAVSRRFKVPVEELAAFNGADLKKRVQIGEKIYIPGEGAPRTARAAEEPKPEKPAKLAAAKPKPPTIEAAPATTRSAWTAPATPAAEPPRRLAMATPPAAPLTAPPQPTAPAAQPALDPAAGVEPPAQAPVTATPAPTPGPAAATPLPALASTTADARLASAVTPLAPAASSPSPAANLPPAATTPSPAAAATAPAVQSPATATVRAAALPPPSPTPAPRAVASAPLPPPAVTQSQSPAPAQVAAASRQPPSMLQPQTPPQPAPRSGFEMAPARPASGRLPPPGGVPYALMNQTSPAPTGRRGRPAALPPSIAREAPSSQPPMMVVSAPASQADIVAAGRGRFIWPVRGEILSGYGLKGTGQRNDGLNIAAKPGEPVRAAASGEVVFAGDQIREFGNLVLLKHANGWVTAYAHLQGITVKYNQQVAQGQQVGVAGTTGNVLQSQLHFELRYAPDPRVKASPVDPMLILPAG